MMELEDRIVAFAARCVKVCAVLPVKNVGVAAENAKNAKDAKMEVVFCCFSARDKKVYGRILDLWYNIVKITPTMNCINGDA